MSNKKKKRLDKLRPLKGRVRGKAYIGNETERRIRDLKDQVQIHKDSLSNYKDSLRVKQQEIDSLKQVIKVKL